MVQLRTFLLSNFPFLSRFTGIRGEKIWPRATRRGSRKGGIARENQPKIRGDAQTRERERHGLCRKAAWQRGCCPRRHYGPKSLSTPGFPIPNPPTVSLLIAKCNLPYFASFFPLSFLQHWIAFIRNKREWKTWSSMMNFNQILQNKNSFYSCVLLLFEYDNRG